MGRRPIMEMIQQLFMLQISLSFSVASLLGPLSLSLCLPPCLYPLYCHSYLSYLPGERANSIRGTWRTNALPLSVCLCSFSSVELLACLPTFSCVINIHPVELCAALLAVPAAGGAQPGCSRALAVVCSLASLFRG